MPITVRRTDSIIKPIAACHTSVAAGAGDVAAGAGDVATDEGDVATDEGSVAAFAPDTLLARAFAELVAPLFERAPRFIARLDEGRPYGSWDALFERAVGIALAMPSVEQIELIDAHPRIGAPPGSVSAHSYVEQGYDRETATSRADSERERIAGDLARLNDAYEARFGFRYVIFVAGRSRRAIVPLLEAALDADPAAERVRAIGDVVAIARDRAAKGGLLDEVGNDEGPGRGAEVTA
jgi:2-oxo-4-hydroxy-4-carboxy--5-ureidoimidazoline (OHCU) decarboxylase